MHAANGTAKRLRTLGREQIAVAELEALGLPLRTINLLEQNLGIIWLEDLIQYSAGELRERVPHLGEKAVRQIVDCVNRLDQIESAKRRLPKHFNVGPIPDRSVDERTLA